jgi:chromosome segregation ATPase
MQKTLLDNKGEMMLMQELAELKDDYERSEERKNELENQIEIMRADLLRAQNSLSRLEQFETEKIRLKEDLELKIEEFNMLTEHYRDEKESYLGVLEHIQDQVNIYKDQSQKFDAEKGSWSKQIDELKTELSHSKATIVKMAELEQKNEKLAAELQMKEIEIYKMKKENERVLEQQMDKFKSDLKKYQDKIVQYEKDREIWEKQMKQMKARFAGLESNLEEREKFIKQFIKQPLSELTTEDQSSEQTHQQTMQQEQKESLHAESHSITPQQNQQPGDWFQRVMSSQQSSYQPATKKTKNSNSSTMDFFTLRSKTTQAVVPGQIYGNQWNEE